MAPSSRSPARSLRLFLGELVQRPLQMGTLWPSSPALARAMALWLPAAADELIVELGPGTGVVTEKLIAAGLPEERLVAIEKSAKMAEFLQGRFPRARVITGDALDLNELLGGRKAGAVFSSLPLKAFAPAQVTRLSAQIQAALAPGGHWVQYSYHLVNGGTPSGAFHTAGSRIVWMNFPPAKVSVYRPTEGVGPGPGPGEAGQPA